MDIKQFVPVFRDALSAMIEAGQAAENGKKANANAWHGFCHALVSAADISEGVDSELAAFNVEAAYRALCKLAAVDMGKNSTPRVYKKHVIDALRQGVPLYVENDDGESVTRDLADVRKDMKADKTDAERIADQLASILKTLRRESGCTGTAEQWEDVHVAAQSVDMLAGSFEAFEQRVERMIA